MAALRPNTDEGHALGSSDKKWSAVHTADVQTATITTTGNVEVGGNLTVQGTSTTLNVATISVEDPLIELARNNSGDTVDGGLYIKYNDGSDKYAAFARDASDSGKFKLLDGITSEPTTTITGGSAATLVANVEGDLTGNADTASQWETARTLTLGGDLGGSVSIDGSSALGLTATIQAGSVEDSMLAGSISDGKLAQDYIQTSEVDDSSIEFSGGSLNVKASGVTNAMLAGSIANAKLSNSSVSFGGVSVALGASDATPAFDLQDATGYPASSLTGTLADNQLTADYIQTSEVDDSSIEFSGGSLNVKASGVTNAMLAGSIANAKLVNDSVSFGGVSVDLGASDATPAFDLQDATGYPTSSLVGTITNAQLAGSIANAKLANSSVSFGGVSVALGASDSTPAFDLQDATGYPTGQLVGTISNAQLAGSIANSKLSNSTITVTDGSTSTATSLGGTITFSGTANEVEVGESSGTITIGLPSTIQNDTSGNAATATALATARAFSIGAGPVRAAAVNFDGSGAVSLTTTIADDQITNDMLANPSLTFSDGSNSEALELGSTLEIGGTTNEVEVSYSAAANKFTVGLPASVTLTSNLDVGGNANISGALVVTGNVTASGQLTASGANISFADNLIEFGVNNTAVEDIGFYGQRGDGSSGQGFAGFAWDESADEWVPFTASSGNEPTDTVGTHAKAKIHASELESEGAIIGQLRAEGSAPANDSASGTAGDIRFDAGALYVCVDTDTWKSVAITGGF